MQLKLRTHSDTLRSWPIWRRLAACTVAVSTLLTGCGNMRLYSETRDKQATAAKDAFDKLELQQGIAIERGNLDKLLVAELAMQDRLAQGVRDFKLRAMLDQSFNEGLMQPIEERIRGLAGDVASLQSAQELAVKHFKADEDVARFKRLVANHGLGLPSCDVMLSLEADRLPADVEAWLAKPQDLVAKSTVKQTIGLDYRQYCTTAKSMTQPFALLKGEIGTAWGRYQSDLAELNAKKGEVTELKSAFAQAQAELDKAMAATISEPEMLPAVQQAVEKFQSALNKLKAAKGVDSADKINNPFLAQFLSEKRIESLESFLTGVAAYQPGEKLPSSSSKAVMLSTLLPQLVDQSRAALADAKKPLVTPYVLARNHHRLNLEAATRDVAASEAIVRHSKEVVDALYLQAQQLLLARNELNAPIGKAGPSAALKYANLPLMDSMRSASAKEKQVLYSATARYLDALNRLDAKRYKLEYLRVADFHARSLAYAEVNTKQWESLIGTSVAQLQEFGDGGWKSEQAQGLINTLMLFWIGSGVN